MLVKRGGMLAALHSLSVYGLRKTAPSRPGFRIVGDRSGWMKDGRRRFIFTKVLSFIEGDRTEELKKLTEDIFRRHLGGMIEACRQTFSISKHILWENIAVYLYWMYDMLRRNPKVKSTGGARFPFSSFYEAEPGLFDEGEDKTLSKGFIPDSMRRIGHARLAVCTMQQTKTASNAEHAREINIKKGCREWKNSGSSWTDWSRNIRNCFWAKRTKN